MRSGLPGVQGFIGVSGARSATRPGEAVHYPAVHRLAPPKPRHPRYLSLAERTAIADLRCESKTVRPIAKEIGRSPSTISRELRRNTGISGRYRPGTAE